MLLLYSGMFLLLIQVLSKKALYHVSFEVPDGKKIALVGASGSGKSTAASLIPRFYDVQEGNVLVGGVDVREIAKNDLMEQIAFVFQNTRLFNDTLLENIRASSQMPHVKK